MSCNSSSRSGKNQSCTPHPTCLGPRLGYGPKAQPCQNPEKCLKKSKKKRVKCGSALAQMRERRPDIKCKCHKKMSKIEIKRRKKAAKLAKKRDKDRQKHKAPKSSGYGQPTKRKKKRCCVIL